MNKYFDLALMVALLTGIRLVGQEAPHEFRVVGGIRVDLTPVVEWQALPVLEQRKVPRPMPHWKALKILSIGQAIGSFDECMVQNEGGSAVKLFFINLPADIRTPIQRLDQIDARIKVLNAIIDSSQPVASAGRVSASIGVQRLGAMAQGDITAANIEIQALYTERRQVELDAGNARSKKVYAMFSGGSYAGLQIWDCGIRR